MIIIGAGMSGLLAASMIKDEESTIIEASPTIPNNHSAVLRFRSTAVGDALDIEFKPVNMMKCIQPWKNPVADSLAYSMKCNGEATLRSIMTADGSVHKRYIAPPNLINRMVDCVGKWNIQLGVKASAPVKGQETPIISTMPMPALMDQLGWKDKPDFKYVHGININATIDNCDAYVSVYIPDPKWPANRVSLTGSKLTIEASFPGKEISRIEELIPETIDSVNDDIECALNILGINGNSFRDVKVSVQKYSKILPIDDNIRKRFIMWASENFNVYSLGRFATWRPGLLMDDVVNDVRVIRKIIKHGNYDYKK